jgi:hypothetical protein
VHLWLIEIGIEIGIGVGIGVGIEIGIDWMMALGNPKRWQATALQRSLRDHLWKPSRFINYFFSDNANSPPEDRRPPRMLRMRNFPAKGRGGRSCPTGATSRCILDFYGRSPWRVAQRAEPSRFINLILPRDRHFEIQYADTRGVSLHRVYAVRNVLIPPHLEIILVFDSE